MTVSFDKPVLCPVVVDRTSDLIAIRALMERVKRGEGQTVLLSGEAGIGKSRLVAEVKTFAAEQGFSCFQGNCFPTDLACPYAPLLDLLHAHFVGTTAEAIAQEVAPFARELFPLLPDSVQLLPSIATLPPLTPLEPEQEKRRLFSALTYFFLHRAVERPVLFIVEDLHWCDDLSLEFLHFLVRHGRTQPLFLLMTYRSDEVRPGLKRWLAQLDRARLAEELELVRLGRSGVSTMLQAILNLPHPPPKELLDAIYELTEGNPFFVEETLKSLINAGHLFYNNGVWEQKPQSELHVPRSIQDAFQQRIDQLSETAQQVLRLAAVVGRHFDFTLLPQLTGYDEAVLLPALKELIAAQLVVEESAERFAFRHALTRQAIYAELLVRERRRLHGVIAETIERLYVPLPDSALADLSAHFYEAEMWSKALEYALQAGERAQALHAPEVAIEHFSRTLDAAQHLALEPPLPVYRARGQAYETLGKFDAARSDYEHIVEAAHVRHDQRAEWQGLIDLGFLWSGRDYARGGSYYQQAMQLARMLGDATVIAHSLNRVGNWHLNREQPHEAVRYHEEALAIFRQANEPEGIAETLDLLGMASYLGGDLAQGAHYYEQAIPLFLQLEDNKGLSSVLGTLIICGGNYQAETLLPVEMSVARIIQDGEQALRLAREIGQRSGEAYALMNMGFALGSYGEYGRAMECLSTGLALAEEINHRQWITGICCALGALYHDLLMLSEARQYLERAVALANEIGSNFWLNIASGFLISAALASNDRAKAETLLNAVFKPDTLMKTVGQRMLWYASAELALARRDAWLALHILDQLLTSVPGVDGEASVPRLLKLRGEALMYLKRGAEAEATLQAALESAQSEGTRSQLWRIYLLQGKLYNSQRRREEAEHAVEAGQQEVNDLAASLTDEAVRETFLQQARSLLSRVLPLSPRRAEKLAFEGLTAREREIAVLIAQGKYNREIANDLILSERTVETHVSNIMLKLGFTSRRQIVLWAVKKGLITEK